MEDKNLNERAIHENWVKMSKILDKELPVKHRKNRFIWLLLFGLISVAIGGYLGFKYDSNKKPLPNVDANIIASTTTKTSQKKQADAENKTDQLSLSAHSIQSSGHTNRKWDVKRSLIKTTEHVLKQTIKDHSIATNHQLNESENKKTIEPLTNLGFIPDLNGHDTEHQNLNQAENVSSDAYDTSIETRAQESLSKLQTLASTLKSNHPNPILAEIKPQVSAQHTFRYGVEGGVLFNDFTRAPLSYYLGLTTSTSLSKKWGLNFGIAYRSFVRNSAFLLPNGAGTSNLNAFPTQGMVNDIKDISNHFGLDKEGFSTQESILVEETLLDNITKRISYLDIMLAVKYHLSPKWGISIGASVSPLLSFDYEANETAKALFSNFNRANVTDGELEAAGLYQSKYVYNVFFGMEHRLTPRLWWVNRVVVNSNFFESSSPASPVNEINGATNLHRDANFGWEVGLKYYIK